jgi:adenylyl-sulfate kinase
MTDAKSLAFERQAQRSNLFWHCADPELPCRQALFGQKPATVWLTGLSGAGKSTVACALEKMLLAEGRACYVLDGDNIRHHLNRDLGFSAEARRENIRRAAEVAHLMNEAGLIVITALISPFREDRDMARTIIGAERFVEVYVSTSVEVCEARDPKGLYAKARSGAISDFTGISSPYEAPLTPQLALDTHALSLEQSSQRLFSHLARHCFDGM